MTLRQDCEQIVRQAIAAVQPDEAVRRALEGRAFPAGRLVLVSVGKAAWSMAKAAWDCVGERLDRHHQARPCPGPHHLPAHPGGRPSRA